MNFSHQTFEELKIRQKNIHKNFIISNKPLEDVTKIHKGLFQYYIPDEKTIEEYKSTNKLDKLFVRNRSVVYTFCPK